MYKITLLCLLMGFFLSATAQNKQEVDPTGLAPSVSHKTTSVQPASIGETVSVYPQSVDYWTGTTDGTTKTDVSEVRTVDPELGWMVFDISSIPSDAMITGIVLHGYVNDSSWPYWSATPMGTVDPVNDDAATIATQVSNNADEGIAYIYSNESGDVPVGYHAYTMESFASDSLQAALAQGWFAVGFYDRDGSASYYINFDGWNQTNPPYLEVSYVVPLTHDVGTVSVDMPVLVGSGNVTPTATVFNYSDVSETFDVTMTMGSYSSTKTVTDLASLTSMQVTFDDWTATPGNYAADVCTSLGTDPNPDNNCASIDLEVQNPVSFYAYNAYDPDAIIPEGPATLYQTDPANMTSLAATTSSEFICAGTAGGDGNWYGLMYNSAGTGAQAIYTMDMTTGAMTQVATTSATENMNGLTWDPTTDTYYGVSSTTLYTVDVVTGTCVSVGTLPSATYITLACSPSGQLYSIDIDNDNFVSIDKTNADMTVIGPLGFDASYAQDMAFDQSTGMLFWACYNVSNAGGTGEWRIIDPATGESSMLGLIGTAGSELCALWAPYQVVPVELTSFNANVNAGNVVLNWTTATETNNKGFEVQRSNGGEYQTLGFVQGNGTSTQSHTYTYSDNNVNEGQYTYRLRQVDFDGTADYSNTVEVSVEQPKVYSLTQNYPNPFNPTTQINFSLAVDSKVTLKVFDILGQEVATLLNNTITAGAHNITFDASKLNSGVYLYKIEANGVDGSSFTSVKKMILTK